MPCAAIRYGTPARRAARAPRRVCALPEPVHVDDLGAADDGLEVGLGPAERRRRAGARRAEPRGRRRDDRDRLRPARAQGPGHPEDARHHPAVADRVEAVAEVDPPAAGRLAPAAGSRESSTERRRSRFDSRHALPLPGRGRPASSVVVRHLQGLDHARANRSGPQSRRPSAARRPIADRSAVRGRRSRPGRAGHAVDVVRVEPPPGRAGRLGDERLDAPRAVGDEQRQAARRRLVHHQPPRLHQARMDERRRVEHSSATARLPGGTPAGGPTHAQMPGDRVDLRLARRRRRRGPGPTPVGRGVGRDSGRRHGPAGRGSSRGRTD